MKILNGIYISKKIKNKIKKKIHKLISQNNKIPSLASLLIGNNKSSEIYVKNKIRSTDYVKIASFHYYFDNRIEEKIILYLIKIFNKNNNITGILIQLPTPISFNKKKILESIKFNKDIDGFHPFNVGRLSLGIQTIVPCTAKSCLKLILESGKKIFKSNIVIIGRSNIVGKPLLNLLTHYNATVTVCNRLTRNLKKITKRGNILIFATGNPLFFDKKHVSRNSIVIDVGINRIKKKIVGDIDFNSILNKAKTTTPVPGGVGPISVAMLIKNIFILFERNLLIRNI
jgi:methylenetetrahydrofolate dehydrogenase (NADP+)/methenyltetrahydrofolate cyclohydrolase